MIINYVDDLPKGYRGKFYGFPFFPVILIDRKYEDDEGLLHHELTHYRQYKRTFMLWELLYLFPRWRLKFEVEAYKKQLEYVPVFSYRKALDKFAFELSTKYRLKITHSKAIRLLSK